MSPQRQKWEIRTNVPPPSAPHKLRIGLLGGSFNPAHEGHREISLTALDRLNLDAIWWLVTPGNPLKPANIYAPYDDRLEHARAIANHPDIVVSDFESRRGLQYTVDTLSQLVEDNPTAKFVWLMGADSFANFHRWKDWRRIAMLVPIAVFNRPGSAAAALSSPAAKALSAARVAADDAPAIAGESPPAWVFVADISNPASSTALRSTKGAKEPPRS
ncbi:MAG: nicotinate-nucleotide adenylyltransferase [Parvularculaceae bacterium]